MRGFPAALLLALAGCSSVGVAVTGSVPTAPELGLAVRDPHLRPPLEREVGRRGVRVVEPMATRYAVHAAIARPAADDGWREPETTWLRGGNVDANGNPNGLWLEIGRDVAYPPPRTAGIRTAGPAAALLVTIEDRWEPRVLWRGVYRDEKAPKPGHPDWGRWLECAAAALVDRMDR